MRVCRLSRNPLPARACVSVFPRSEDRRRLDACQPALSDRDVEIVDPERSIGHRLTVLLRSRLSIQGVMVVLVVAGLLWVRVGWHLGGTVRVRWFLVPLLAFVAAACVAGLGHWFPKKPYEGPSVISLGTRDAITLIDLVGLTIAALTVVLALRLAPYRWRRDVGT